MPLCFVGIICTKYCSLNCKSLIFQDFFSKGIQAKKRAWQIATPNTVGGNASRWLCLSILVALCAGCMAPGSAGPDPRIAYGPSQPYGRMIAPVNLQSLPQTIGIEHQDRVHRFARLASLYGVVPPKIDQMQLPAGVIPGINYGVPVVRIQFQERVFFDFNKDTLRPEAEGVLDLLADSMRRDVPDAQVTILGHTDAIGTDVYNLALSKRRALTVTRELVRRGVRPAQLSIVAIGKYQPIAPNSTDEGRALNRRVEFLISASQDANIALVHQRRIREGDLATGRDASTEAAPSAKTVEVFRAAPVEGAASMTTPDHPVVTLQVDKSIILQKPEPQTFTLNKPEDVVVRPLDEEFKPFEGPPAS